MFVLEKLNKLRKCSENKEKGGKNKCKVLVLNKDVL